MTDQARDRTGHGEPTIYLIHDPDRFARLLASVTSAADAEPDATFTREAVIAEGQALVDVILARVHDQHGRH